MALVPALVPALVAAPAGPCLAPVLGLLAPLASLIISTAGPLLPLPLAPAAGAAAIVVGPAVVGLAPPAAPSPVLVVVLVGTGSLTLALAGATAASTTALAGSRRPVLITTVWQLLLVLRPTGRASRLLADRRPGRQHGLIECRVVLDDGRGLGVEGVPEPHPGGQPLGGRFPVVGDRVDARRVQPGLGDPPLGVVFDGLLGADADEGPGPLDRRDAVDDRPDALGGEGPVLRDGNVSVDEAQLLGGVTASVFTTPSAEKARLARISPMPTGV